MTLNKLGHRVVGDLHSKKLEDVEVIYVQLFLPKCLPVTEYVAFVSDC